jgi:para-aminobenzoate synthetase component 1
MDKIKTLAGSLNGIHIEKIVLNEPFIDFSARFSSTPGTVVLLSGGELDCARHHILAAKPWLSFVGRGRDMAISIGDQNIHFEADPFETLRKLLSTFSIDQHILPPDPTLPVASGLFGYLSYDLKDHLEELPRTSIDDLSLPQICLFAPSIVVVHDKTDENTYLCVPERVLPGGSSPDNDLEAFKKIITSESPVKTAFSGNAGGFRSNFEKKNYMDSIEQIKEYIASGHVYQVNMSQRFEMGFDGSAFSLFQMLYNNNPAPFFAFIQAGDHQIVSTSPERFVLRTGNRVETRPIKGTRPRGNSPEEDKRLCRELMESRKDDAELSMIVDLLRNDLGKVCAGGTVRVTEHKRLEAYQNVYHLVSVVEGKLDGMFDSVDLITATFPGGSITGCPKIRSMEIIDELEPNRRHIYTGSIGYISFHDTMDLSIAIRTATIVNNRIIFSAGGGIVFDSDPGDEFDETLHKGRTLMEAFQGDKTKSGEHTFAWINGTIKPMEQVAIPVMDPGFQYGYGFFETIRVDKGKPKFLDEHTERFNRAWKQLFSQPPPDLSWDEIIDQVITRNGFKDQTAAVKMIATKGDRDNPPFNNTLVVTSHLYTHRLAGKEDPGLHILTYSEPRQTPLADHKTLNYLYYFLAGKWARATGGDEALIINPDGTVSETNTGNIVLIKNRSVIVPVSPHVLPGTMEKPVIELLRQWGYEIKNRQVRTDDLFRADQVLITNSLMGAVPALTLDRKRLSEPSSLWQEINDRLL